MYSVRKFRPLFSFPTLVKTVMKFNLKVYLTEFVKSSETIILYIVKENY